ncbi:acyl-CoA thioesterase [Nocardia sp. NPDC088792]|uniref:acyl-CoA thioesterase n=1 Tax=Nocardia sp. NPDC088792 TaxID=3364332 RepID=UPI0038282EE7
MSRHVYLCPLRWSDMDADGHVHNAVHLRYLEETRIDLFRTREFSGSSVVAQMDIDYLAPLRYRARPVRVETWVTKVGTSSYSLAHEVLDEEAVYTRAECTMVAFDPEAQRSRKLNERERVMLEEMRY